MCVMQLATRVRRYSHGSTAFERLLDTIAPVTANIYSCHIAACLCTLVWPGGDFAFPDTNVVKTLLAMLSALRLVAGSKHAPRAFDSPTWQAVASSDRGIHKTNQNAREVN